MSPTRDECIAEAGEVYGAILADPERAAQLRAYRAAKRAAAAAEVCKRGEEPT